MEKADNMKVDKGLVAWFIALSPEERLRANDNAIRAIWELRKGFIKESEKNENNPD